MLKHHITSSLLLLLMLIVILIYLRSAVIIVYVYEGLKALAPCGPLELLNRLDLFRGSFSFIRFSLLECVSSFV